MSYVIHSAKCDPSTFYTLPLSSIFSTYIIHLIFCFILPVLFPYFLHPMSYTAPANDILYHPLYAQFRTSSSLMRNPVSYKLHPAVYIFHPVLYITSWKIYIFCPTSYICMHSVYIGCPQFLKHRIGCRCLRLAIAVIKPLTAENFLQRRTNPWWENNCVGGKKDQKYHVFGGHFGEHYWSNLIKLWVLPLFTGVKEDKLLMEWWGMKWNCVVRISLNVTHHT